MSERLRASTASFTIPSSIRTPEHDNDYDDFDGSDGHHDDYHADTHGVFLQESKALKAAQKGRAPNLQNSFKGRIIKRFTFP